MRQMPTATIFASVHPQLCTAFAQTLLRRHKSLPFILVHDFLGRFAAPRSKEIHNFYGIKLLNRASTRCSQCRKSCNIPKIKPPNIFAKVQYKFNFLYFSSIFLLSFYYLLIIFYYFSSFFEKILYKNNFFD